jgi:tryptophan-rich sensory protein
MVPYPALIAAAAVYYLLMGVVLDRALAHGDTVAVVLALVVLVLNEAWNVLWFGRRSLRWGFLGAVVFLVLLLALEVAVLEDVVSALLLAGYVLWVAYDLIWLYQMWRLNEA